MRRILILTLLFLPAMFTAAQQFPVQVTPQLLPPYTLQVSEYYSPGAAGAKLNLLLLLRDFNKPTLQVRLRMSIEGQSVAMRTKEDVVFSPLTLESGIPKYVDPSELAQYFNSNNLEFSGITRQQYETTGKLPEGFYTFCFEVVEVGTGLAVSNKGCGMAWMTLNEPPILNIPRKAEEIIPAQNPATQQNITFQWTPRHTASPTAAFTTDYIFSIVEIPDNSIAPEAAFLTYTPLHTAIVSETIYQYDHTKPALVEGHRYAWRVQAKAMNGLQDMAMFRNNGYSETFWFTYQNNCALATGIEAVAQGQRVGITWDGNVNHLEYKVEYREKNNPLAVWFEIGNTIPRVSIGDLKYTTTYEYRVGAACVTGNFIFSPINEFVTNDSLSSTVANCGIDPNLVATNEPLLQQLNPGDTIKAGDFNVITTQVNGQGGNFSGQGFVSVSYLANMKIAVRFANIGVATDKKLKTGIIETTYDPTESGLVDVDEALKDFVTDLNNLGKIISELIKIPITRDSSYFKQLRDAFENVVEKELTDDMKADFQEAIDSMSYYKNEYDQAVHLYDSLPDGPEKELQKQRMDNAKDKFEQHQEELNRLNTERERLVTEVTDVFIKSVKELSAETATNLSTAPQEYQSEKTTVSQLIYEGQQLSTPVSPDTNFILKGTYIEEIDSVNVPSELSGFAVAVRTFTQKKINFKILSYIKALERYYVQENRKDKLRDDTILDGVGLIKEIITRKKNNETEAVIKEYIKNHIRLKILTL